MEKSAKVSEPLKTRLSRDQLIDLAHTLPNSSDGKRVVLGIVGAPGSGKSTLSKIVADSFGDSAVVVPMDGFHLDNPILIDKGKRQSKGAVDTFDVGGFEALLWRINNEEDRIIYAPRFDRSLEISVGSAIEIRPEHRLVIVEGLYLLESEHGWGNIKNYLSQSWFLDVSEEERTRRLIKRRMDSGEDESSAVAWVQRVDHSNAQRVLRTERFADFIIQIAE